ncbi:hypothetical protein RUM44_007951 [Polyplax serrata]|uniref:Nose resistant-to-fluoxetine protein N-terminal domain-containing protein n=1 Tax=Polyplax serrata TaxID=468196 RepID=A0ABR1BAY8_POLSC
MTFYLKDYVESDSFTQLVRDKDIDSKCGDHVTKWLRGLEKGEMWALRISLLHHRTSIIGHVAILMDSIQKGMDGIFIGRVKFPGHFDECVRAVNDEFTGKYCTLHLILNLALGHTIKPRATTVEYSYGICVPSTCSVDDLNVIIRNLSSLIEARDLIENDCSVNEFRQFRPEDWAAVTLIAVVTLLAISSTVYDLTQRFKYHNYDPHLLLISFSFYTNVKSLFRISRTSTDLQFLNGIRFFSIVWVVLGHSYVSILFAAPINLTDGLKYFYDKNIIIVNNAFVAVETFFFLSGLLVCLVFFRDISKKGYFDVPVAFIHRYIRVTPAFAMVMFLQATVVSRTGNGPFWKTYMDKAENDCRSSWWAGLLYIQNYAKPEALCLGQSWYLSTDMQMFWLSPFFLYPMLFWPSLAPIFLLIVILASSLTNFTVAYVNEFDPNLSVALGSQNMDQFKYEYIRLHTRMTPWLIGLFTGYIICGIKANKIRINLSRRNIILGWIFGLGLCAAAFVSIIRFFSSEYTPLESAFYLAFHRVGWSLGLAWITLACVSGYGGPINYLLSWDIFQPLAKLSYCTFLVHMTLQLYRLLSSRVNQYIRHFDIIYAFVGDIVLSNLLAIPVTLLFELPFGTIEKYFFRNVSIFPFPRRTNKVLVSTGSGKMENKDIEKGNDNANFEKDS